MTELVRLTEPLLARGFGVTHEVRIREFGRKKVSVIKAVRELTGWGLADAKHAVEGGMAIVAGVSVEQAEEAAATLRKAGATVEIGAGELVLYAFDPADPRRGNQPLERLRVVDLGIAHDHGRLGAWTTGLAVPVEVEELLTIIDEQRRAWADAGKRQATAEIEILEQLSAREGALEDRLRRSEAEERQREAAVYGDWLQARGDPRGLIAAVAFADQADELARLVGEHASHLFGPGRELLSAAAWSWCGPVFDTLLLRAQKQREKELLPPLACERVTELLAIPVCACLRSLAIERPVEGDIALGEALAAAACAPGLRELRIGGASALTLGGDAWVRITSLALRGRFTLGPARLPSLRRLDVDLEVPLAPLAASFTGLEAPALEHLAIKVRAHDFWDQNYGPMQSGLFELLSQPSFARLQSLVITAGPMYLGFAKLLTRLPAIATLQRIDLRDAEMTDDCRSELERSRDRLPGLVL